MVGILIHGAEFNQIEGIAVLTYTTLAVEDAAGRIDLDDEGCQSKEGG